MQVDYQPFIDRVIHRYEGGYGWNRADPGGPTKYGITCFDLAEHRSQRMTSMTVWAPLVAEMTLAEAEEIYSTKYAHLINFNFLRAGIDCCVLDYAINSGVSRALKVAAAIPSSDDAGTYIDAMCDERLRFMHAIRGGSAWAEFGHGWGTRVADLRQYCKALAAGAAPAPGPDLSKVVTPKATHVPKTAGAPTAGGAVGTGAAMHAAGFHWLPTALAVGGIIAAGFGYEIWQERQAAAANALVHV